MGAGAALDFESSAAWAESSFLVGAIGSDGVVGVGDGDDARAERNILSGAAFGIAGAIEHFVVMQHHVADVGQRVQRLEKPIAEAHVLLHQFPFRRD